jgi:hypothetical protein
MATSTKTMVTALKSTWNVQCAEVVFNYGQVGDMSSEDYHLIGQLTVPANSYILDVQVHGVALWVSGAAVAMIVGDGDDDNGFHVSTDLKATALLAGEANTMEHPGGLAGAYTDAQQRVFYSSSARTVIADITVTTHATAATAGETRVLVMYCCPPADSVKP